MRLSFLKVFLSDIDPLIASNTFLKIFTNILHSLEIRSCLIFIQREGDAQSGVSELLLGDQLDWGDVWQAEPAWQNRHSSRD